jgi:hypothetical protein
MGRRLEQETPSRHAITDKVGQPFPIALGNEILLREQRDELCKGLQQQQSELDVNYSQAALTPTTAMLESDVTHTLQQPM